MKPLELALTPTRNRRLNEVTGMVLLVAASLLFLALASYHPTDPSLNTVGAAGRQAHNWTGLIGATVSRCGVPFTVLLVIVTCGVCPT